MEDKIYIIRGGNGQWDDAYPFNYGIFTDKEEANKHCLEINKLIEEAKYPFDGVDICSDNWHTLNTSQKLRYHEVIDLWSAEVIESELNVLLEVGILKK